MRKQSMLLTSMAILLALLTHDSHAALHHTDSAHTNGVATIAHSHSGTPNHLASAHEDVRDVDADPVVEVCSTDQRPDLVFTSDPTGFDVAMIPLWSAPLLATTNRIPSFEEPVDPPAVRRAMLQVYLN